MGRTNDHGNHVLALYRPRRGQERKLRALIARHVPTLRRQGLVTGFEPILLQAKDGTFLELFEWKSTAAVRRAHSDPVVHGLWEEFGRLCTIVTLGDLAEAKDMFPHFVRVAPAKAAPARAAKRSTRRTTSPARRGTKPRK